MHKFIAVSGMTGAGKSLLSDYLREKYNFEFVRFGQITLDLAKERWGTTNQEKEGIIRVEMRQKHGMAAYAVMNMDKFKAALKKGNLVGDDLISFEEYLYLKEQFGEQLILLTLVAGKDFRYGRLSGRDIPNDEKMRFRSHTPEEAHARDMAQLTQQNEGPSIAMGDYYILNQGSKQELYAQIEKFIEWAKQARGLIL